MKNTYKKADLENNCKIELEHIQLEIVSQRGQHLRHFIDQYFCYKHEYVTRTCKPAWGKIFWKEYVSIEAINSGKDVIKEHIVPLNVLKQMLLDLGSKVEIKDISDLLDEYVCFATITKEEDNKLNKSGLKSKMPEICYDNGKLKKNFEKLSRYNHVQIKINYTGR